MPSYRTGDYVKAEFRDEDTSESEWMWVRVESSDGPNRLVFGLLDSVPVLNYGGRLKLGTQVVVSFDNIREHKRRSAFRQT